MKNWSITIVIVGIYIVLSMIYFAQFSFSPETLQKQIQCSARTAFFLFTLVFSAYPLFMIWGSKFTNWLVSNTKYLIVSFALIHFYHLSLITIKNQMYEPVFHQMNLVSLLAGIIVYLFIGLMLMTSFPFISKYFNEKSWRSIHTFGGYLVLTAFTIFYYNRMMEEISYLPLLIIALIVWVLRLTFKISSRN